MFRAIIVDDEELLVKWLEKVLVASKEIEICRTFLGPLQAYDYVKENRIDIAFLDISMPEINGMRLSSLLHELDDSIKVVFVTAFDDYAVRAFELNALDYLLKPVTAERMAVTLEKLRKTHRNGGDAAPGAALKAPTSTATAAEPLTSRETEMLHALADGLSNGEIAVRFGITEATVKTHVFRLYGKLGVKRRGQAIAKAREMKWIE
ncbi:response regulator transcription factor [Paenibacillus koleovorans]|uniref:response regulator transcription factor n=1 Tax=Paenibacillus koleovorans TaxID=121608 RepID=UPI000FD9F40A|nr:response regulator transcription factor [Paenibacillus koleovorans]